MKVIIEAEKSDLTKLIDEYKQNHVDDFDSDELVKYVRGNIINAVSIGEADIRFFIDEEKINYVTW